MLCPKSFLGGCLGALIVVWCCTAQPAESAVIAFYEFEPGNLTADSSGNSNTLLNFNATSSLDVPGTSSNGSAAFNGSTAFMRTVNNLNLSGADQLTIEFFYKPNGNFGGGRVMFEHSADFNSNSGGLVTYGVTTGGLNNIESGYLASGYHADRATSVPMTDWHHIAIQYDRLAPSPAGNNDVIKIFVDYTEVGATFLTNSNRNTFRNDTFFLGARNGSSLFFDGLLDQFRISDTLLNPSQFLQADAPIVLPAPEPNSLTLLLLGTACLQRLTRRKK